MKAVFYIGNGFDIATGAKTGYKDFIESELFEKELSNNDLATFIKNNYINCGWADLEWNLYEYSKAKVKDFGEDNNTINEQFKRDFESLSKALEHYLKGVLFGRLSNSFQLLIDSWKEVFDIYRVCSFNYTPFVVTLGMLKDYKHLSSVHGFLEYNNLQDENKVTLGIDSCMRVTDRHSFLYKNRNHNTKNKGWVQYSQEESDSLMGLYGNISYNFDEAEIFVIYGLSLGMTDNIYFKTLFENLKKRKILIYHYGDNEKAKILDRIESITENSYNINNNIIWIDSSKNAGYIKNLGEFI